MEKIKTFCFVAEAERTPAHKEKRKRGKRESKALLSKAKEDQSAKPKRPQA